MKKITLLTFLSIAFVSGMILISSCTKEGPAGLTGAQGETGATGTAGEDGINGTDGTAGCFACHDGGESQGMFAKTMQWEASTHANGGHYTYNVRDCGTCHTSQGFRANIEGTYDSNVEEPNPINCYTCHNIHDTYTGADLGFTTSTAVTLIQGSKVFDMGDANLCANCHQGRTETAELAVLGGPDVVITSSRYGSHYAPHANVLIGSGFAEFSGDASYGTNHEHGDGNANMTDGCVTCHMFPATGIEGGGHTMRVREYDAGEYVWDNDDYEEGDEYGDIMDGGCVACHADQDMDDYVDPLQAEVKLLLAELQVLLDASGIRAAGDRSVSGTYSPIVVGAFMNYYLLTKDHSYGVHNPIYTKAILNNSIDALEDFLAP